MNKNYVVHYGSIYTNKKVAEAFQTFLKQEHNQDTFNFLLEVNSLKQEENKIKRCKEIIQKYINTGAPNEINLSVETKKFILSTFEPQLENEKEWILKIDSEELFRRVFHIVNQELKSDPFKRFVRSKLCDDVVKNLQHDSTVVSPFITSKFNFNEETFIKGFVEDQDFEFGNLLLEDSFNWELVQNIKGVNTYLSSLNYFPDFKTCKLNSAAKYECVLPVPFSEAILSFMCDESVMRDPHCSRVEVKKYYSFEELKETDYFKENSDQLKKYERPQGFTRFDAPFGFPFDPRVIVQGNSGFYDPETKKAVFVLKPCFESMDQVGKETKMEVCPKKNSTPKLSKCYQMFDLTFRVFQKLEENKTIYQEVTICQIGGWVDDSSILKMISKDRGQKLKKTIIEGSKAFLGKKISDFEEQFTPMVDGIPKDGYGRMLWDLQIEKKDKEFEANQQSN
jgi:hypothetical protein